MSTSKIVLGLCICLCIVTTSCSTVKSYEFYLDKDETQRDVYKITASINSDGTCSMSIDDAEFYEGLRWSKPDNLVNIDQLSQIVGSCRQYPPVPFTDDGEDYWNLLMFIIIVTPENIASTMLKSGTLLDVNPAQTLAQSNNPAGVYFTIFDAQTVKKPKGMLGVGCGFGVESLKGEAYLQKKPDGLVSLSISALGFATNRAC